MSTNLPLVVTISRLVGSGGDYLGHRLASHLKALYLDHEIVRQAAQKLKISEEYLETRDEKFTPFWTSMIESIGLKDYGVYIAPSLNLPNDKDIFNAEKEVILRVAEQHSAVIVGRAGSYILREHHNHISILLHASEDFRKKRLQELYNLTEKEAIQTLHSEDEKRAKYLHAFTGSDWSNARQYHLCLDTGIIGITESEEVILKTLQVRFGVEMQS